MRSYLIPGPDNFCFILFVIPSNTLYRVSGLIGITITAPFQNQKEDEMECMEIIIIPSFTIQIVRDRGTHSFQTNQLKDENL